MRCRNGTAVRERASATLISSTRAERDGQGDEDAGVARAQAGEADGDARVVVEVGGDGLGRGDGTGARGGEGQADLELAPQAGVLVDALDIHSDPPPFPAVCPLRPDSCSSMPAECGGWLGPLARNGGYHRLILPRPPPCRAVSCRPSGARRGAAHRSAGWQRADAGAAAPVGCGGSCWPVRAERWSRLRAGAVTAPALDVRRRPPASASAAVRGDGRRVGIQAAGAES